MDQLSIANGWVICQSCKEWVVTNTPSAISRPEPRWHTVGCVGGMKQRAGPSTGNVIASSCSTEQADSLLLWQQQCGLCVGGPQV